MYRRYSRELKEQACALVISEDYNPTEAGERLGIPPATLRLWLSKRSWKGPRSMSNTPAKPQSDDPTVLKARIVELEAKLRRAEMEREILKKATAYFASPHLPASNGSTNIESNSK
jgi:transposase